MSKSATPNARELERISAERDVPQGHSIRDIQARNGWTPSMASRVIGDAPSPRKPPASQLVATTPSPEPKLVTPAPAKAPVKACAQADCDRAAKAKGLCQRHYDQTRDTPRNRDTKVLRSRARYLATVVLIENHRDEFDQLVADSAAAIGLTTHNNQEANT